MVAIGISSAALIISLIALGLGWRRLNLLKRTSAANFRQEMRKHDLEVNEAFLRHKVRSPYADLNNIEHDPDREHEFTSKAVMMLHQMNILVEVYLQRDLLTKKDLKAKENWARNVVAPWIQRDKDLRDSWNIFKSNQELDESVIEWLKTIIDIKG